MVYCAFDLIPAWPIWPLLPRPKHVLPVKLLLELRSLNALTFMSPQGTPQMPYIVLVFHLALIKHATLSSVRAGDVGISDLDGDEIGASAFISPCLCVLPMGWTWALHICQCVMASVLGSCGFTGDACIVDGEPGRVVSAN